MAYGKSVCDQSKLPNMSEKTRTTILLTQNLRQIIAQIKEDLQSDTMTDVIARSVMLMHKVLNEKKDGRILCVRDGDEIHDILCL